MKNQKLKWEEKRKLATKLKNDFTKIMHKDANITTVKRAIEELKKIGVYIRGNVILSNKVLDLDTNKEINIEKLSAETLVREDSEVGVYFSLTH